MSGGWSFTISQPKRTAFTTEAFPSLSCYIFDHQHPLNLQHLLWLDRAIAYPRL